MWPEWQSMLTAGGWGLLALAPPLIVALYFLKLKRRPLRVPSTLLWRRTVEDLHVNSLWQRLRRSMLLWLQLLVVALVMLALGRPSWQGSQLIGQRHIFLLDNSASMNATDVAPTRFDEAKRRIGALIDEMEEDDVAMLVAFSDTAQVAQSFTRNRQELRRGLAAVRPTDRATSILDALRAAAGLANPGRLATEDRDVPAADPLPARVYILSDGNFPEVTGFSLGNLEPIFIPIGSAEARNVAITALGVDTPDEPESTRQLFARVENFTPTAERLEVSLFQNDTLIDAASLDVDAEAGRGVVFDLGDVSAGVVQVRLASAAGADHLATDDVASLRLNAPRSVRMLLVTPGNEPLELALTRGRARSRVELRVEPPSYLDAPDAWAEIDAAGWDWILFDRCVPARMPQASTWFLGAMPPEGAWSGGEPVAAPQIVDVDVAHPLLQHVELGDVLLAEMTPLAPAPSRRVLVDTTRGPLLAIAPRERFEDLVLGVALIGRDTVGTNWPVRLSFPVFVLNLIDYAARARGDDRADMHLPGSVVSLPVGASGRVEVRDPSGASTPLPSSTTGMTHFADTDRVGVYQARLDDVEMPFCVNLLNAAESAIRPRPEGSVQIGYAQVTATSGTQRARREGWRWLVFFALAMLVVEWIVYTRRL